METIAKGLYTRSVKPRKSRHFHGPQARGGRRPLCSLALGLGNRDEAPQITAAPALPEVPPHSSETEGSAPRRTARSISAQLNTFRGHNTQAQTKAAPPASRSAQRCRTYRAGLQRCTAPQDGKYSIPPYREPTISARKASTGDQFNRLRVLAWKAGGLPKDERLEAQVWLHTQQDYDTRWRHACQFTLPWYHEAHAGPRITALKAVSF